MSRWWVDGFHLLILMSRWDSIYSHSWVDGFYLLIYLLMSRHLIMTWLGPAPRPGPHLPARGNQCRRRRQRDLRDRSLLGARSHRIAQTRRNTKKHPGFKICAVFCPLAVFVGPRVCRTHSEVGQFVVACGTASTASIWRYEKQFQGCEIFYEMFL